MKHRSSLALWSVLSAIALAIFAAVWFVACDSGSGSPTTPVDTADDAGTGGSGDAGDSSATSSLTLLLTDAPTDEICELHVYIEDLRVKPDGAPQVRLGSELGEFELLALRDGPPVSLGNWSVETRRYQFIEILLDQSRSYVIEKEDPEDPDNLNCVAVASDLQIPSEKIKVAGGPFDIAANTAITIDFDAAASLKRKGNVERNDKGWQLKPEISIASVEPQPD